MLRQFDHALYESPQTLVTAYKRLKRAKEDVTVKPVRPIATVRVKRELAQLLRRLRTIRRAKLSNDEIAEQMSAALREAGTIIQLVAQFQYVEQRPCQVAPAPSEGSSRAAPRPEATVGYV
jgi:hypothetical protein